MNMQALFKMLQRAQLYMVSGLTNTAKMLVTYLKQRMAMVQLAGWMRYLGFQLEDTLSLVR